MFKQSGCVIKASSKMNKVTVIKVNWNERAYDISFGHTNNIEYFLYKGL